MEIHDFNIQPKAPEQFDKVLRGLLFGLRLLINRKLRKGLFNVIENPVPTTFYFTSLSIGSIFRSAIAIVPTIARPNINAYAL